MKLLAKIIISALLILSLSNCGLYKKTDGSVPIQGEDRARKNISEGKGISLKNLRGGTNYEFSSSNPMWRASLDIIEFMPLSSVNYSGGIIITDWYSENDTPNESIKISIRFLTNEIRSDALEIKVFNRKCENNLLNCKFIDSSSVLVTELKKEILKKAALYKKEEDEKKKN